LAALHDLDATPQRSDPQAVGVWREDALANVNLSRSESDAQKAKNKYGDADFHEHSSDPGFPFWAFTLRLIEILSAFLKGSPPI
jgi:hypothetical protein